MTDDSDPNDESELVEQPVEHTLTLPDGEEVEIERVDKVFPTIVALSGSARVTIEDGRVKMSEDSECHVTIGTGNNSIDDPSPLASIHADIAEGTDEDVYAELTLDDADQVREVRDALTTILRYHEEANK